MKFEKTRRPRFSLRKRRGTPTLALEKAISEDVIANCDEIDAEIARVLTTITKLLKDFIGTRTPDSCSKRRTGHL